MCNLQKSWPLVKYNIKGERKEADWSVAKNLLKPKDGGKVKVVAPLSLITHCNIQFQGAHLSLPAIHIDGNWRVCNVLCEADYHKVGFQQKIQHNAEIHSTTDEHWDMFT